MFVSEKGRWRLINAVPTWPPSEAAGLKLLEAAKEYDFWYGENQKRPKFRFPYFLGTLKAAKFFAFDVLRWQDLYQDERPVSAVNYVLERFVGLSKSYGFRAVFVMFPNPEDLLMLRSDGQAYYRDYLESVAVRFREDLVLVRVLDEEFDLERFHLRPFAGHPSAYGQQVIARAIYKKISAYTDN